VQRRSPPAVGRPYIPTFRNVLYSSQSTPGDTLAYQWAVRRSGVPTAYGCCTAALLHASNNKAAITERPHSLNPPMLQYCSME
jgi:hypothetical protein